MKKYIEPNVEIEVLQLTDVILESIGNNGLAGYQDATIPDIFK